MSSKNPDLQSMGLIGTKLHHLIENKPNCKAATSSLHLSAHLISCDLSTSIQEPPYPLAEVDIGRTSIVVLEIDVLDCEYVST